MEMLRDEMALDTVVFDDPEIDSFVQTIDENLYSGLLRAQDRFKDWRNIPLVQRRKNFSDTAKVDTSPFRSLNFDEFDALMRLDSKKFERIAVDFKTIPFGRDNPGIYKDKDGEVRYVIVKLWLRDNQSRFIYLTTEEVVSAIIRKACNAADRNIAHLPLDYIPSMYPITLPLRIDKRAKAIQKKGDNDGLFIDSLVKEILRDDSNAVIIANGAGDNERIYSFQKMKGLNGLQDKNIYVILTWLSADEYVSTNIFGQFCGDNDIISHLYQDRLNQASGRNTGFRKMSTGRETAIICTKDFERLVLRKIQFENRITYFIDHEAASSDGEKSSLLMQ